MGAYLQNFLTKVPTIRYEFGSEFGRIFITFSEIILLKNVSRMPIY